MTKRNSIAFVGAILALIPVAVAAAPTHKMGHKKPGHTKVAAATTYECTVCHMTYSAADAKKNKYKCDMNDGGKLVPVKKGAKPSAMKTM